MSAVPWLGAAATIGKWGNRGADAIDVVGDITKMTRREAFRSAKRSGGIPASSQFKKHKFVYDSENRTVYEFIVDGKKRYVIEHLDDVQVPPRGPHFHSATDLKGSPFEKLRYDQAKGHHPENINGYKTNK